MSMRNIGASGYVVKASELEAKLTEEVRLQFQELVESYEFEKAADLMGANLPTDFPPVSSVFRHGDENESEDLERGEAYVEFDESSLFVKTPTPAFNAMEAAGIQPAFCRWVVWA